MPAVLWLRRDLRLADHPALLAAVEAATSEGGPAVAALFVLDDALRRPAGAARLAFLYGCLREIDERLGGRLVIREGDPVDVVPVVARELGARTVHITADFGPYGAVRDQRVEQALVGEDRELVRTGSPYAVSPGRIRRGDGSAYQVFTPYLRAWRAHGVRRPVAAAATEAAVDWQRLPGLAIPSAADRGEKQVVAPGERAGIARLEVFRAKVGDYANQRNLPARDATSRLSAYLKYGCLHPRTVLAALDPAPDKGRNSAEDGVRRYVTELAWRDFYADVLWRRPDSARADLTGALAGLEYADPTRGEGARHFNAWKQGRTGYPIVDAGMRQLLAEGWMHNRVRMITASFLVKDLHIWWRHGARWFMQQLADGDLASNSHGWQWVAGTGTDPAPYVRIFNPVLQGEKFDPSGDYVRRYVPELRDGTLSGKAVHAPWLAAAGPPNGYPEPIVDHASERKESLSRYDWARSQRG